MMKIQILQDGTYSRFNIPGYRHRVGKQQLAAGDVVDYPDWYAEEIVASGLASISIGEFITGEIDVIATDAARSLANELDIDLLTITGSGTGGRITVRDVRKAAQ